MLVLPLILVMLVLNRNKIKAHLNVEKIKKESVSTPIEATELATEITIETEQAIGDYLVNDSLYRWDDKKLVWIAVNSSEKATAQVPTPTFTSFTSGKSSNKPIVIDWELLLDIEYQLKYYQSFEMEIYAPVFTEALKAIDGKEVIIKGFVVPFDESGELLALSANPFASCFFCGKASPASVISMYLRKQKLYKIDDFRKFRGVLKLNYDDPEEYYYILKNAVPIK